MKLLMELIKLLVMPRLPLKKELIKLKLLLTELPLKVMLPSKRRELKSTKKLMMLLNLLIRPLIKPSKLSRMLLSEDQTNEF